AAADGNYRCAVALTLLGIARLALGGGAPHAAGGLPLPALRLRQHDRPRDSPVPWLHHGGVGGGRPAAGCRAGPGLLLEPQRLAHALRYRLGADLLRSGLCLAGDLVATRFPDLAAEHRAVAGGGHVVVETAWMVVSTHAPRKLALASSPIVR